MVFTRFLLQRSFSALLHRARHPLVSCLSTHVASISQAALTIKEAGQVKVDYLSAEETTSTQGA